MIFGLVQVGKSLTYFMMILLTFCDHNRQDFENLSSVRVDEFKVRKIDISVECCHYFKKKIKNFKWQKWEGTNF
jgi:hypothetical protein